MAQYKVPQDVEADDKLVFGLSFRQFVYIFIGIACIAMSIGLFQTGEIGIILGILPIPVAGFFLIMGLPIKRDQPMETYLAAMVSFYFKPRKHYFNPGQRDSTVEILAPKIVEAPRTRDISGEEASHRLSFLANVVDTEGHSINAFANSAMQEDFVAEAASASDMYESNNSQRIEAAINASAVKNRSEIVEQMRAAIQANSQEQNMGPQAGVYGGINYGAGQQSWNNNAVPMPGPYNPR
ncbi:PrgI family protein [Candidatus Saccharibacteria bacterium]|nr:PrgI family protein [Candidatus Saccharibacteria bacterium]